MDITYPLSKFYNTPKVSIKYVVVSDSDEIVGIHSILDGIIKAEGHRIMAVEEVNLTFKLKELDHE